MEKKKYAEYVTMTPEEFAKLNAKYGKDHTRDAIDKLNAYKGSKGKRYKSDYFTILSWVVGALGLQPIVSREGPIVQTTPGTMRIIEELRAKRRERKLGANE